MSNLRQNVDTIKEMFSLGEQPDSRELLQASHEIETFLRTKFEGRLATPQERLGIASELRSRAEAMKRRQKIYDYNMRTEGKCLSLEIRFDLHMAAPILKIVFVFFNGKLDCAANFDVRFTNKKKNGTNINAQYRFDGDNELF